MVKFTKTLKVGEGNEPDVFLGPIQNSMQYERVKGFFADIEKEKWNVAVGGKNDDGPGYFINPTIIDNPAVDSRIVTEEPFGMYSWQPSPLSLQFLQLCSDGLILMYIGPIVPLLSWKTEEEAVTLANNTHMGLGASVWSSNIERANNIARQIDAGNVWVNGHSELDPKFPFGGHKESGIGHEWGIAGLKSFCNVQTLYLKKSQKA
jgi:acyl-CoA reductase-like NAD-dependent aldehyde dehydrogenase